MPSTSTELERKRLLDEYMNALKDNFIRIGFKRVARDHFSRKMAEGTQDFYIVWRSRVEGGTLSVAVTPIVQSNFPDVKQITKAMGLSEGLPSVGAALGIYTPYRSMKEWWINSVETIDDAAKETWNDIEIWGVQFWNQTCSIAETLNSIALLRRGPEIETEATMRYLISGINSALEFIHSVPEKRASNAEKESMIEVLTRVDFDRKNAQIQPENGGVL
jgi:hypothetical protein